MAETIGLAILSAAGVTDSFIGIGTASALSVAGVSVSISTAATIVGTATIIGASIGLQYALSNPEVPKPENGAVPLKQAIPPRRRGYGINRLSGYYLLFLAAGGDSQDVLAFHSGPIEQALQLYLHDNPVSTTGSLLHGQYATVVPPFDIAYEFVAVQVFYGTDTQNVCDAAVNAGNTSGIWTSAHAAKGIACIAMTCGHATDPSVFTKIYPQGLPLPSIVAKCAPIWDPRDGTTTHAKATPVLQLIDYLTEPDGGMGEDDLAILLPPARLAQWMTEADLCDADIGGRPRYASSGFYDFDNSPESVIGKLLASCDGWLVEAGDGTLALTVGVYREPTDPPLTSAHIRNLTWRKGEADETQINQLDVTFTNPALGYVSDPVDAVRDEDAISAAGIVRAKPLDLSWVQNADQATMLGKRALLRLNPEIAGTFVCNLYALRYMGKRWIKVQEPRIKGMEDCVIEIQDKGQIDLLNARVTFNWIKIDPVALAAIDGVVIDGLGREDGSTDLVREDGSFYLREDA
ncbi:hypothetical protein [Bradyrhizobium sp. SEMIA]|uniref:hypothetical protein n=1 Tax=Bradyrhizobium sp. SEMIA TaxID=2597515 RepID=UPI00224077D1|nr:hypothetical protein [Bradyrhizobium sp. SEMIA]